MFGDKPYFGDGHLMVFCQCFLCTTDQYIARKRVLPTIVALSIDVETESFSWELSPPGTPEMLGDFDCGCLCKQRGIQR